MPGGEEFDATLVEALFMNELLALNDLVSSSDGDGDDGAGGGCDGGDVTSGFQGLAGVLGSSVPAAGGTPPVQMSSPMLGESTSTSSNSAGQLAVSPLRPNAPHRTEVSESFPPARAGAAAGAATSTAPSGGVDGPENQQQQRQQQQQHMVDQFATLAGKLGVHLPPNILSALQSAAAASANESTFAADPAAASTAAGAGAEVEPSLAAIEEGSRKRKASSPTQGGAGSATLPVQSSLPSPTISANLDAAASSAAAATSAHRSSKKKKPRLQDTASRYAALRAENETLKRHLANVTHTTALVDRERAEAEQKLADMVTKGVSDEAKVGPVLEKFGEMYSDYGRRRQEELTFHLEQLERYVYICLCLCMFAWPGFYYTICNEDTDR